MSTSRLAAAGASKEKDGGKGKFKRPFPYPLPQFSNFSMDFPVDDDGVLSYQRRYQMTQQQRISRFRQQRNFRSLREPTFNYSGNTSTYERYSREGDEEEHQNLMRPTSPTISPPPLPADRQSPSSWRGSSTLMFGGRNQLQHQQPQRPQMRLRQPLLRSGGSSSSRSREDDVVIVENNCVSAAQAIANNS